MPDSLTHALPSIDHECSLFLAWKLVLPNGGRDEGQLARQDATTNGFHPVIHRCEVQAVLDHWTGSAVCGNGPLIEGHIIHGLRLEVEVFWILSILAGCICTPVVPIYGSIRRDHSSYLYGSGRPFGGLPYLDLLPLGFCLSYLLGSPFRGAPHLDFFQAFSRLRLEV
jgi:hypothetical protein